MLDHVRAYVEYQQSTGLDAIPRRPRSATRAGATEAVESAQPPVATAPPAPARAAAAAAADLFAAPGVRRAATLEELRAFLTSVLVAPARSRNWLRWVRPRSGDEAKPGPALVSKGEPATSSSTTSTGK